MVQLPKCRGETLARIQGQFFEFELCDASSIQSREDGTKKDRKNAKEDSIGAANDTPRIGVLAIQGDYAAHAAALDECGAVPLEIRKPEELSGSDGEPLDGLILPGGETTTMLKFLDKRHFFQALAEFCAQKPVFGTCAGAILLAREVRHPAQRSLGLLDAVVERNAYGRQIDSSILVAPTALEGGSLEMVFIRAPRIVETGPSRGDSGAPRWIPYPGPPGFDPGRHLPSRTVARSPRSLALCPDGECGRDEI